ncbi:MAG: cell wall-active antibiotics response protein [Tannerella sp.]|jgi:predicted membrane protein|nr:cell wall-active antibiotics response protein [Tannerella sp.]
MHTTKNKAIILASLACTCMAGGGMLLSRTVNSLYHTSTAPVVVLLLLTSVFLYTGGASLISKCVAQNIMPCNHGGINNGVLFAWLLIGAGLLLLGFNTGTLPLIWKDFFCSWAMLIFIAGILQLYKSRFKGGIIITATGLYLLFPKMSTVYPDTFVYEHFFAAYWPAGIVLLGIFIFVSLISRPKHKYPEGNRYESYTTAEQANRDGKINYRFICYGMEQVILDPEFKGGNIDVTFGGMELDLRRTSLPEGDTILYINARFGGVEITAPDHWEIEIRPNSFVGGVCDSRVKNRDKDPTRRLVLIAKCTFAGVDIR